MDPEKITGIFRNLDEYVGHLQALSQTPREEFLADFTKTGSVRYYLQVAIGCCLDAANHIIAALSLRPPADYADAFRSLGEAGIVPDDFVATLQQMAGLRNRLVHRYWLVDDEVLYQLITTELGDFDRFKACVIARLPEEQQGS